MSTEFRIGEVDRFRGCLLGLACGDAVGTTVEFKSRASFKPLTDMVGGGPFDLMPGEWTDDTSMALCLGTSLLEKDGFDPGDQMQRYCSWWKNGYLSSMGVCFDIGNTVSQALGAFISSGNPFSGSTDPKSAGNGSIMRLAPVPMYYACDQEAVIQYSGKSSMTTHGALECVDACRYLGLVMLRALKGMEKDEVLAPCDDSLIDSESILGISNGAYFQMTRDEIRGSGYVVKSLEAALWCFYRTSSFKEAILMAANLGDDADTTAAICGQVAGAYYGESGIPKSWLNQLVMMDKIRDMADQLYKKGNS